MDQRQLGVRVGLCVTIGKKKEKRGSGGLTQAPASPRLIYMTFTTHFQLFQKNLKITVNTRI